MISFTASTEQAVSGFVGCHYRIEVGTKATVQAQYTQTADSDVIFSFTASAEQAVTGFVGGHYIVKAVTHATIQRTQTEDVISSTRQLFGAFGLRLSHLARTFDAFQHTLKLSGFEEKNPTCWQLVHRLNRHMQPLVQLIIELSPLLADFTAIIQSTLDDLSTLTSPPSTALSTPTPVSQTLRTLEYSIRHILQQSRLHVNAMFSICTSDTASGMKLPDIPSDLDSRYCDWLRYFMCIDDDLHDLSRLLNDMFSSTANIADTVPCVYVTQPIL